MYDDEETSPYKYKMWWTRQATNPEYGLEYDTIWYARSKDGFHWIDQQMVLYSEGSGHEYAHAAGPTIVKVNNIYHMFYESWCYPYGAASVYYAYSTNGINWIKTKNASNQVIPVLSYLGTAYDIPENRTKGWCVQPSVIYKNDKFLLYYINGTNGWDDLRRSESTNAAQWNPDQYVATCFHPGNNLRVKYSEALNKYVAVYGLNNATRQTFTTNENWWIQEPGASWWPNNWSFEIHLMTSLDTNGIIWPDNGNIVSNASDGSHITLNQPVKNRQYPDILSDKFGNIMGGTPFSTPDDPAKSFVVYYMEGPRPDCPTNDHRQHAEYWDIVQSIVKLTNFSDTPLMNPPITPNLGNSAYYNQANANFRPVAADFDGDGVDDKAVYIYESAEWFIKQSEMGWRMEMFGGAWSDLPVPADYNGDYIADLAVYRPSNYGWYILGSDDCYFGAPGVTPIPFDYAGDHKAEPAVFVPPYARWYYLYNNTTSWFVFGSTSGDTPIPGDYDADGTVDKAVFRTSTAQWLIALDSGGSSNIVFGSTNDIPVPLDSDGSGSDDLNVFRQSNKTWYQLGGPIESWQ